MKSKEEIELMLSETQLALEDVTEWVGKAYAKFKVDREYYGLEADDSEWRTALDAEKVLIEKVNVLNWVLNK